MFYHEKDFTLNGNLTSLLRLTTNNGLKNRFSSHYLVVDPNQDRDHRVGLTDSVSTLSEKTPMSLGHQSKSNVFVLG